MSSSTQETEHEQKQDGQVGSESYIITDEDAALRYLAGILVEAYLTRKKYGYSK